jgi:hypothetical protein
VRDGTRGVRGLALGAALTTALALGGCKGWPPWPKLPADAAPADTRPPPAPDVAPDTKLACGGNGEPACPLEGWMETELSGPLQTKDWEHLGRSLRALVADAPAPFARWGEWASRGSAAARGRDGDAVRAACKGCHNAYRDDYRRRMPDRPAPGS